MLTCILANDQTNKFISQYFFHSNDNNYLNSKNKKYLILKDVI